jgi:hypothetical protein
VDNDCRLAYLFTRGRDWNLRELSTDQVAAIHDRFPNLSNLDASSLGANLIAASCEFAQQAGDGDRVDREQRQGGHASRTATQLLRSGSPIATQHGGPDSMMAARKAVMTDPYAQTFMASHGKKLKSAKLEHGVLTIQGNDNSLHRFDVRLPVDVEAEIFDGKFLLLRDRRGVGFGSTGLFGEPGKSDGAWAMIAPFSVRPDDVAFDLHVGGMTSGSVSKPQESIDELIAGMYQREYQASTHTIHIGDRSVEARGPDRDGFCELTSGRSSVLLHPDTRELKLGKGWGEMGATASIESVDLAGGTIRVNETRGDKKSEYLIELDFESKNPNRTYSAEQVS